MREPSDPLSGDDLSRAIEEAHDKMVGSRPRPDPAEPPDSTTLEEAYGALFRPRDPYRPGGPMSVEGRQQARQRLRERRARGREVDDVEIWDAYWAIFGG